MRPIAITLAFLCSANGFITPSSSRISQSSYTSLMPLTGGQRPNPLARSSVASLDTVGSPDKEEKIKNDETIASAYMTSDQIQKVRQDLISKYLKLGRSRDYAEAEVDKFLNDPERSQQFLAMRQKGAEEVEDLAEPW
eukprot:CAMPEP_0172501904 /NCGR_PEP_ID=MMETSP1066-20121228/154922_1 /TAXON_ID=671091 /ORGANISM="Coscinodiscus wailesii, Strain CCMP2513" /LENGTH=137 /DNA_ID=CAMNT_0013276953 /DNA_START=92 /DNA_END=502 /DNA_ORIENTATION=+